MFKANGRQSSSEQANKKELLSKKFTCSNCGRTIFKDDIEFGEETAPCSKCGAQMEEAIK
jgi:transcription elongation factor Elf1